MDGSSMFYHEQGFDGTLLVEPGTYKVGISIWKTPAGGDEATGQLIPPSPLLSQEYMDPSNPADGDSDGRTRADVAVRDELKRVTPLSATTASTG